MNLLHSLRNTSKFVRAEDLDAAVLDRCDETINFPLPDNECRKVLITQYFDRHIKQVFNPKKSEESSKWLNLKHMLLKDDYKVFSRINSNAMNEEQLYDIAAKTDGFSGREIEKFILGIQSSFYSSEECVLSRSMIDDAVDTKVNDHKEKKRMLFVQSQANISGFESEQNDDDLLTTEYDRVMKSGKRYSYHRYGSFSLPN